MPSTGGRSRGGSFDRNFDIRPQLRRAYEYDPEAFLGRPQRGLPQTLRNAAGELVNRVPILPNFVPPPNFDDLGPPSWRDPFGGEWRGSPSDPVSPYDCARYANSPYCGGSGLQLDPVAVDISVSSSHQCVTVSPSLFFVSLPGTTACRITEEFDPIQPPPPPIPPIVPDVNYDGGSDGSNYDGLGVWATCVTGGDLYTPEGIEPFDAQWLPGVVWLNGVPDVSFYDASSDRVLTGGWGAGCEMYLYAPRNTRNGWGLLGARSWHQGLYGGSSTVYFDNPYGYYVCYYHVILGYREDLPLFTVVNDQGSRFSPPFGLMYACEEPPRPIFPPLTPTPPMSCCEESADNNELLKRIAKAIGPFPVQVPETFIEPEQGFFQDLFAKKPSDKRTIENLRDLSGWLVETIHDVLGAFHQVIEIQDADLTREGNQTEKIILPNIAETLAELIQISFQANRNTQALVSLGMRTLLEAGLARKEAIVGQSYSKANAEYLSYNAREVVLEVPFSFKLPSSEQITGNSDDLEDLAKLLKESMIKVKAWEFRDDDRTLQFYLTDLLQAAAIIKAVNFQRLNPGGDMAGQVMNLYRLYRNFSEEDDENRATGSEGEAVSSFAEFLEKVERGFIDSTGATNTTDPYGRPYDERPRIREIGVESGTIDGTGGNSPSGEGGSGIQ